MYLEYVLEEGRDSTAFYHWGVAWQRNQTLYIVQPKKGSLLLDLKEAAFFLSSGTDV